MVKKGEKMSAEQKEKIRQAHLGRKHPWNKGKPLTEEHKQKIREKRLGSTSWNAGKTLSAEHRRKIGEGNKGRVINPESIKKAMETRALKNYPMLENNPNWKGGISFGEYCPKFNNKFKDRVRSFFGYKCVLCGKTKEDNSNYKLSVHHVYDNPTAMCDDTPQLFVCLCMSCHLKARHHSKEYRDIFIKLIKEEFDGKCY